MKKTNLTRRDFLKLSPLLTSSALVSVLKKSSPLLNITTKENPNIIIILLDALSAKHVSFYNYPRRTMPKLERFKEKSTTFYQHYSSANNTTPSTASIMTGAYPWTHRAFHLESPIIEEFKYKNIFSILNPHYTTFAYTQNFNVEILLYQFNEKIDKHPPMKTSSLSYDRILTSHKDLETSYWGEKISRGEYSFIKPAFYLGSMIDLMQEFFLKLRVSSLPLQKQNSIINSYWLNFILEDTIQWLSEETIKISQPFLVYAHLIPPHDPYDPSNIFQDYFKDGYMPPSKPNSPFTQHKTTDEILTYRRLYDQFIAHTDSELGILFEAIENTRLVENTYVIVTSDHGELFERGIWGHNTEVLYEPLTHVPLIIHKPGQTKKDEVYIPTSHVDLLPTISHITGQPIPDWVDGEILPTFTDSPPSPNRSIFSLDAKQNHKYRPLTIGTLAMIKWPYKLIYYFGYEELAEGYELYYLEEDPEELTDLYPELPDIAKPLKQELHLKLDQVNKPLQEKNP